MIYIENLAIYSSCYAIDIIVFNFVFNVHLVRLLLQSSGVVMYSCDTMTVQDVYSTENYYDIGLCTSLNVISSNFNNNDFHCTNVSYSTIANAVFDNSLINTKLYTPLSYWKMQNVIIYGGYWVNTQTSSGTLNVYCDVVSEVYLSNITIINNAVTGILIDGSCAVVFKNHPSVIANNHSPYNGGGIKISSRSTITSDGNTTVSFVNNTAAGFGGAIYIDTHVSLNIFDDLPIIVL
jgi:predicted outer membrane repeat protein